jgi:hypothetical protein
MYVVLAFDLGANDIQILVVSKNALVSRGGSEIVFLIKY